MSKRIVDEYIDLAFEAVEDWDGVDDGDLIRLLAGKLGLSLFEVKGLVEKLMREDTGAYHAQFTEDQINQAGS